MATKNNPGPFDCYTWADPDEPMFVLLGRDKHAPALVWLWAVLGELDSESPEKIAEARQCAIEMIGWCYDHGGKSVGVGQSALAAVLELIRCANMAAKEEWKNAPTDNDIVRRFFGTTTFEDKEGAK